MRLRGFYVGRGQRVAALLLLLLFGECLWSIAKRPMESSDYRFARCGREMWERPSPLAGYFTTCGNLNGDGTFAYRVAGFPLTLQRLVLLTADHFRRPENRLYANGELSGTTWESRHELNLVKYLLRIPFALFAVWLGGGLWWVTRRLFGNEGGSLALALYAFCPAVVHYGSTPNNEVLAMWGLYGVVYTSMGVAHALQGPRRKWRPRIILLTVALGLTAAAHSLAAIIGFVAGAAFFFYLAVRRRSYVAPILIATGCGAFMLLFASFSFRLQPFTYVFTGGSARFWWSLENVRSNLFVRGNIGILVAAGVAVLVYLAARRSRYVGNTAPLVMVPVLAPLYTTQVSTAPWFWALPFLLTFTSGVFADVLESRQRKLFLLLTGGVVAAQAAVCWATLAGALP